IFYNEEINDEAAQRFTVKLDLLSDLDICYAKDPRKPMLQTRIKINGNPSCYHRYANTHPEPTTSANKVILVSITLLETHAQVIGYMNQVYLPSTPPDNTLFENKILSMREIYSETILITNLFDEKSVKSFSTWYGVAKLDFVSVEQQHKYQKNEETTRRRLLWVLKEKYRGMYTLAECEQIFKYLFMYMQNR
ncbi:hypothetical protein CLU79DRAFT_693309, partial [Phycomyces nitens]